MKANVKMPKDSSSNKSTMRKLIPATSMLLVSAVMLTSSTYAWFTMSREVEVTNISMSATVPEDIQLSLGAIAKADGSAISDKETTASLKNGLGILWKGTGTGATADNGAVVPPTNEWDWSNIADISEYYQFGKLIPASSTTGNDIFFTPNANGVGKTIAVGAKFYQAADNLTGKNESQLGITGISRTTPLAATAHAITAKNNGYVNDSWNQPTSGTGYTTAVGWDNTNDDGYYVDIPVWFRTSSSAGAKLSVQAYVKPRTMTTQATADDEALYRALRVTVIDVGDYNASGTDYVNGYATTGTTRNLIPIADGMTSLSNDGTTDGVLNTASPFAMNSINDSILNWYGRTVATGASASSSLNATGGSTTGAFAAVNVLGTGAAANVPTYAPAVLYSATNSTSDANVVATLAGPTLTNGNKTSNYGLAHKVVVRVWLEGEDPDCWNETAGQDWSINLKFNNEVTNPTTAYSGTDLSGVNTSTAPVQP